MKQKSVGLTIRAAILALALILVAGSPALPPFDGVAYAQEAEVTDLSWTALPSGTTVELEWDEVTGASSYRLWKGEGSGQSVTWGDSVHMTFDAPTVSYVDSAVTAGMIYSYVIEVYDGDGNRLGWSDVENVTTPGGTQAPTAKPTAKPTVTLAADGLTAITVSWSAVDGADNYRVRYWTSGLSGWMDLATAETGRTITHPNLTPGRQYFYIVRGQNAAGNGPYSGSPGNYPSFTLEGTTTVPQLTLSRVDRTTVDISWTSTGTGMKYDLQRRKVHVADQETDDTVGAWGQLPSGLITDRTFRDNAANYVPTDAVSVRYEYKVRSIDSNDVEGPYSTMKSMSIPKAGAVLSAPTDLRASPISDSSIRVSWPNVPGADFYELQWKSGDRSYSTSIRVDRPDSGNPYYDDTDLSPSTKYTYQVRAVDINGAGDFSSPASTTTRSTAAAAGQMPKVTGLTVTDATSDNAADSRKAKLTWSAVSEATHYEIQRYDPSTVVGWKDLDDGSAGSVTRITKADAGSPPTHEDDFTDGAAAGKTYFYVVSAVEDGADDSVSDAGDNEMGDWSDYKSVTFKAHKPGPPTAVTAVKTNGTSILVSWTGPLAGDTSGSREGLATAYTLRWRTGDSSSWSNIAVSGTSYHHTGRRGNTSYHYRVRAENSGGESDYVNLDDPVVLGNTLNPPTGLKAVDATDGATVGIKVSWSAVSGASGYEVQRFGTDGMWGNFAGDDGGDDDASGTMITDSAELTAGMTYLYRVRTVKETAMSGWSAPVSGMTVVTKPDPPTVVATSIGRSMIRLSWNAVAGATTYELEFLEGSYATADDFGVPNLGRSKITISGNHRNYVHTGRKAGTRYTYRLRAALAQGGETDWSAPVRQYTKPAKPDLSASSTTATTMVLKWDAVSFVTTAGGANRLTAATTAYQIQRRLSGTGDWTTLDLTSTVGGAAATCTNNKCMFTDGHATDPADAAALDASTSYFYRIRATVTQDQGTYTSYWDNTSQSTSN